MWNFMPRASNDKATAWQKLIFSKRKIIRALDESQRQIVKAEESTGHQGRSWLFADLGFLIFTTELTKPAPTNLSSHNGDPIKIVEFKSLPIFLNSSK